jgi:hypothetical protein
MMSVHHSVECLAGETEVLRENLLQCRFVHHKSHMTLSGLQPGPRRWEATTNSLSYCTAILNLGII